MLIGLASAISGSRLFCRGRGDETEIMPRDLEERRITEALRFAAGTLELRPELWVETEEPHLGTPGLLCSQQALNIAL